MKFTLAEVSGAFGDLGTFIPLIVSLSAVCDLDIGTMLLFAGLYNVLTGLFFNQPIPVQPMKAIAAVAIAESLSPGSIAAAGLGAGLIVFLLAITGLVEAAERHIPKAVVRGIQLGVGTKLLIKGLEMTSTQAWNAWDGPLVGIVAIAFVALAWRRQRCPTALILFLSGLLLMFIYHAESFHGLIWGWKGIAFTWPAATEWKQGLLQGALPQIPLTLLNSVIAVCALSADLYPQRAIGTKSMAMSVGLMNLLGCCFGAMPMCHGSGGLAGQHRFGARTGGSVVMLGAAKILLALTLGSSAAVLLAHYPANVLGVLLIFAGIELALPVRTCRGTQAIALAVTTAAGCVFINTALGFALGIVLAGILYISNARKK